LKIFRDAAASSCDWMDVEERNRDVCDEGDADASVIATFSDYVGLQPKGGTRIQCLSGSAVSAISSWLFWDSEIEKEKGVSVWSFKVDENFQSTL
jgi:hypothetical protein